MQSACPACYLLSGPEAARVPMGWFDRYAPANDDDRRRRLRCSRGAPGLGSLCSVVAQAVTLSIHELDPAVAHLRS